MEREEFDSIKLGDRIGFVSGPGEFPEHNQGTITAKTEDRWGFHVDIKMDDGDNVSAERFTKTGVGCYQLGVSE